MKPKELSLMFNSLLTTYLLTIIAYTGLLEIFVSALLMGGQNVCQLWTEIPCEKRLLSCMAFSIYKDVRITYQLRYLSGRKYLAIWNLSVSPTHGWSKSLMSVKSDLRYRVSRGFSLSWPLVFTKPFSSRDSCLWRHKQTNNVAYKQCKR